MAIPTQEESEYANRNHLCWRNLSYRFIPNTPNYTHLRMTYTELINQLSEELDLSDSETKFLVDELVAELTEQLGQGYNFTIPDLGTFNTKIEEVQKVYNPNYGKFILMPPKRVVEF
jgi:DNA-binding protein HU-beta